MCPVHRLRYGAAKRRGSGGVTPHIRKKVDKAIPLQTWTGPEDSRRLRLLDFKTVGT